MIKSMKIDRTTGLADAEPNDKTDSGHWPTEDRKPPARQPSEIKPSVELLTSPIAVPKQAACTALQ